MDYNLAGIRNRVLIDKLDDEEFDGGIVDRFINDTQRDIFNQYELSFQEKIFSGAIPTNSVMFQMPSDVAEILSQTITAPDGSARSLKHSYTDFRSFNEMYPVPANGTPGPIGTWTLFARNMLTSAPTDQAYTMNLFYIKTPDLLQDDNDVPEIPEEFSELLILGAYIRVLKRNEDFDQADYVLKNDYNPMLNMLVSRYGFRKSDGPIKMKNKQVRTR